MRSCCPCFFLSREKEKKEEGLHSPKSAKRSGSSKKKEEDKAEAVNGNIAESRTFNFRELATATKNFRQETLIGEGGFGRVYKGHLHSGQVVAVKKLDRNGLQGNEFLEEVMMLSRLQHQNLVNLIGYCADGEQRLLVYEYLPGGSLDEHLFNVKPEREPLDWFCRMRVASGAAQGLEYLHTKSNPPVLYKDLKSSNILLDEEYNPKLSDVALSSRTMGTYGYSAPEHGRDRKHTIPSDVYSFGVVLLELITGRKAMDNAGPTHNQSLVTWAQPIFKDPRRFYELADPLLDSNFPERGLNQVVAIAAMCLQEESAARPMMTDIVNALSFLTTAPKQDSRPSSAPPNPTIQPQKSITSQKSQAEVPSNDNVAIPTSANEDANSVSRSSSSSSSDRESNSSSDEDAKYDDDGKDIGTANDNNSATTNDYGKHSASLGLSRNTNSHSSASNDSSRYSPSFGLKSDRFCDDNGRGSSASSDRRSVTGNSEVQEEEDGKQEHNGIEGISIHLGSMSIGFRTGSANSGFKDAISEEGNEDEHDNDKDQNGDHHIGDNIDSSSSSSSDDEEEDEISSETSDNFGRRPEID